MLLLMLLHKHQLLLLALLPLPQPLLGLAIQLVPELLAPLLGINPDLHYG